jgi:hypothetical protein
MGRVSLSAAMKPALARFAMTKRLVFIISAMAVSGIVGCSDTESLTSEVNPSPAQIEKMVFDVYGVRYDIESWRWIASATIENTGVEAFPISVIGGIDEFPEIVPFPTEGLEQLIEGEWEDITPWHDGIGLLYMIGPGEKLDMEFNVGAYWMLKQHDVVRFVYCGLTSNSFSIGDKSRPIIRHLLSTLPSVSTVPDIGTLGLINLHGPEDLAADGFRYQLRIDRESGDVWLVKTGGIAGVEAWFGPSRLNDPAISELIADAQ